MTFDELAEAMWSWGLFGKLLCPNRYPLSSLALFRTAQRTQQMTFSYKSGNETILVIQPIFKHHPSIKSTIYYQHTAFICKLKDFMNSGQNNRVLSRTVRFFMAEWLQ
ncbi:hypothetical protein ES703_111730 [subsurface metagenome]